MKLSSLLTIAALVLTSVSTHAYLVPGNGPGKGGHKPHKPHVPPPPPAPYPNYPGHPHEPNPYYPQPGYGYNDFGPARTIRWMDAGTSKIDKGFSEIVRIHVGHRLVNEVLLRSSSASTQIHSAIARLSSGRIVGLPTGIVRENGEVRLRLDSYYSLRIESIELQATSHNLIGARARLNVMLGLAD